MSVLGIVVFALFASLFARLYYLQVMATDQYQVAAQENRIRVVPVEAPRGRILDRNGKVLVDNRISVQVTDRPHGARRARGRRAARVSSPTWPRPLARRQQAQDRSRTSKPTSPTSATARTCRSRSRATCPRSSRSGSTSTPRSCPASRPSGSRCGATPTVSSPPTCSATRADHRRGVRGQGRLVEAVHAQRQDREVRRREDLRGRPPRHARARGRSRSTPRTNRSASSTRIRRSPATTSSSTSTSTCRRRPSRRCSPASPSPRTDPCTGCQSKPKAEKGSTVVLDPKTGGVIAMASFPTFNPADFVDGISDIEWAALTAEENNTPLNNWAIQGQYAPGSTFKPFSAVAGLESGLITPDTTVYDDGEYEVPDCTGDSCAFSNDREQGRTAWSTCAGRSPCRPTSTTTGSAPSSGSSRTASAVPRSTPTSSSSGASTATPGIDLSSEQAGRIPSPAWLAEYCADVGCVDGADSWRTGNNVNMAIGQGDVLLTPLQLASGYATIGNGGTVWQPHVVKEVRDGVTQRAEAHHRAEGAQQDRAPARVAAGALRRPHRRHHPGRRHRRRRLQRLPARHVPDRRQDRHRPGPRAGRLQQGAHRGVRRLRPGHRRAVRHLGAPRGGRLRRLGGGAGGPPPLRRPRATRCLLPPAPEGGRFEVLDTLAPTTGDVRD